jgi:hypothetical protein
VGALPQIVGGSFITQGNAGKGKRKASAPLVRFSIGWHRYEQPPHPSPPKGGRGLRRVGEAKPSPTRSWVRGVPPDRKLL